MVVAEAVRHGLAPGVQKYLGAGNARCAQKDDPGPIDRTLTGPRVDNPHAGYPLLRRVILERFDDAVAFKGEVAGGPGHGQGDGLGREIGAVRAPTMALTAVLTARSALLRHVPGQVGHAADREHAAVELAGEHIAQPLFTDVERHGRLKLAVGKLLESERLAADADGLLDVAVPGLHVVVADGPVDAVPVRPVGLEVLLRPAVGLASPDQRLAADDRRTHPVERFVLVVNVGVFVVRSVEGVVVRASRVVPAVLLLPAGCPPCLDTATRRRRAPSVG